MASVLDTYVQNKDSLSHIMFLRILYSFWNSKKFDCCMHSYRTIPDHKVKLLFVYRACLESSGDTVVRELASHQCGPGTISWLTIKCVLSLLVLYSALRGFSTGTLVFLSPQKLNLIWVDLIWVSFNLQCSQLEPKTQCSPYQAVTGKIYCLKQQFLLPATSGRFTKAV